ncbi:MAG: hypothetical protein IPH07_09290 [Deltaproteobacteria bacterium]|nr:hypothetical protein [Deltaproteobacteria bacterium]MBK8236929.1 hypothetical protein [Deltaproteobacteria bacterium]MBK8719137.1 hypothetical protein [Deltaproteobacteria bacterium]MBP7289821.1 hypothetical protein [Nannocystaceae bacterium]
MTRTAVLLSLVVLTAAPLGCQKKDKETKNPDDAAESDKDPLEELKGIPVAIQAEVDGVLKPITDVDVVIDQVTTMPERLGVDPKGLRAMASASLKDGTIAVNLDIGADAKAEIEGVLATIKGIGIGLKETPQRVPVAAKNIVAQGAKAAALVAKLTAKFQAKLSSPFTKAEEKLKIQADLDAVMKLDVDIKTTVNEAKSTVMGLPAKGTEALAKITAAFTAG